MLKIEEVKGVIFDVDDTLLDNGGGIDRTKGMHAISRLAAVHAVGEARNLPVLLTLTPLENVDAFDTAPVHSLESAVWNILHQKGLAASAVPDILDTEMNELVAEIVKHKETLHDAILLQHGREVPGASSFIWRLARYGLGDKLAVASAATRKDIDVFLGMIGVGEFFPDERIMSKANITQLKPHPEAFDRAFASLGLPDTDRGNVLALEDDPRGIQSANASGLYSVAITTRFRRDDAKLLASQPDVIVDSYLELTELLGLPQ